MSWTVISMHMWWWSYAGLDIWRVSANKWHSETSFNTSHKTTMTVLYKPAFSVWCLKPMFLANHIKTMKGIWMPINTWSILWTSISSNCHYPLQLIFPGVTCQLFSITTKMLFGASWAERDWRDNLTWIHFWQWHNVGLLHTDGKKEL